MRTGIFLPQGLDRQISDLSVEHNQAVAAADFFESGSNTWMVFLDHIPYDVVGRLTITN